MTPIHLSSPDESRVEIGAQAESALRTIRVILAVMSCLLVGAIRPESTDFSMSRIALVLAAIVVGAVVLNMMSALAVRSTTGTAISQIADTLGVVALVVVLDEPLAHQAWVLLIIPMVSATVRSGALATLLTWIGGSALFLGVAFTEVVSGFEELAMLIRIPGLLLAVAITVSVLARWMREGWEIQNTLTDSIVMRERRLAAIENAARALHRLAPNEALEVCATSALELGFGAASIADGATIEYAVGDPSVMANRIPQPPTDEAVVTAWTQNQSVHVFSVALREPQSGRTVVAWSSETPTADQAQALATLVGHTSTAIETASLLERLQQASRHDPLTGLLNRRGADDAFADLDPTASVGAAFIDLDDLKLINDRHGHDAGDKALAAIAARLTAAAPGALVARFGGDEFVIVMPHSSLQDITTIGLTLLDTMTQPVAIGPLNLDLGLSVGVATGSAMDMTTVLTRADEAVYQAKSLGKGQLVVSDPETGFRTFGQHATTT